MKAKTVFLAVVCVLPIFASIGYAQTSNHAALTVKVPFEFVVGNRTFPAGVYKFRSLLNSVPPQASIDVLEVRSTEGRFYSAIVTDVVAPADGGHPRLVFARSGRRIFLSEVWESGKQAGCRIPKREDQTQTAESENNKLTLIASADVF
jgi:hypothetical protein